MRECLAQTEMYKVAATMRSAGREVLRYELAFDGPPPDAGQLDYGCAMYEVLNDLGYPPPAAFPIVTPILRAGNTAATRQSLAALVRIRAAVRRRLSLEALPKNPLYEYAGPYRTCILCAREAVQSKCEKCKQLFSLKTYLCRDKPCWKQVGEGCHRFRTCCTFFGLSPSYCWKPIRQRMEMHTLETPDWQSMLECVD